MEAIVIDKKELREQTIRSVGWSTAAKFFRQFLQLIFQILLARLLAPSDFGLLGMILVFSSLTDILKNLGLGQAIIQNQKIGPDHLNSVFWVNIFSGLVLLLMFQGLAPLIARFYDQPVLEDITRVYSVIYLIGSFNVVQDSLLQKNLQFKRLFIIESVSVMIGGLTALFLAWKGYGVWTLVWQYLIIAIVNSVILWITSSWRPGFHFQRKALTDLKQFGTNLLGHDLLSFVSRNIDNLLIGKFLGAGALGIYSRAYFLMLQPINLTNQVLARVMFPVLTRLQGQPDEIRKAYLKSTRIVSFFVFPLVVYVFVMAEPLIRILLGEKWEEVAILLKIFSVYCLVDMIGVTTGWIYKSIGRTDVMFRWAMVSTAVIVTAIIIGMRWGVKGVAFSYTVSFLTLLWLPGWYICFRLIGLKVGTMLMNLFPVFISALLSGAFMYGINQFFLVSVHPLVACLLVFLAGMIVYILLARVFNPDQIIFVRDLVNKKLAKKQRAEL